jgi:hypothetical protein
MENTQKQLSFQEIFKEALEFFEGNAKNILIGYLVVALGTTVLFFLPAALKSFIASALLMIFISAVYHADKSKTQLSLDTLKTLLESRFLPVFALSILFTVFYIIGCFLLILPGIYLMIALQFATWTLIFKPDTKFFDTLQHSRNLTKGRMWNIFVINIIAGIVIFIVFGIASLIFSFALGMLGMGETIIASVNYILSLIISVLAIIFQLFLYIRVEASYKPGV